MTMNITWLTPDIIELWVYAGRLYRSSKRAEQERQSNIKRIEEWQRRWGDHSYERDLVVANKPIRRVELNWND